ncbi:MAG: hypothetical protein ACE366_12615 [Bradymonadia bacterium]
MAYQACFHCEQLFELQMPADGNEVPCPQCRRPLEPYEPDADELETLSAEVAPEARTMALSPIDLAPLDELHRHPGQESSGILASAAIEGLGESARRRAALEQGAHGFDAPPSTPRVPMPAVPAPIPQSPQLQSPQLQTPLPQNPLPRAPAPVEPPALETPHLTEAPELLPLDETPITLDPPAPTPRKKKNPFERGPLVMPGDEAPTPAPDSATSPRQTRVMAAVSDEDLAAPSFEPPASRPQSPEAPAPEAPAAPRAGGVTSTRMMDAMVPELEGEPPVSPTEPLALGGQIPAEAPPEPAPPIETKPQRRPQRAARRQPKGAGRKWLPWVVGLSVLGAGAGVAIMVLSGDDPEPADPPDAAAPVATWPKSFEEEVGRLEVSLPMISRGEGVMERPFVIGGTEGLTTTAGAVPGLPAASKKSLAGALTTDGKSSWLRNLDAAMKGAGQGGGMALVALDQSLDAQALALVSTSLLRAGFEGLMLVARQAGTLKGLPYALSSDRAAMPPEGAVVVYIGQRQATLTVQGTKGDTLARSTDRIEISPQGTLSVKALSRALKGLGPQGARESVVIRCGGDMSLAALALLMDQLRALGEGQRFTSISLAVR